MKKIFEAAQLVWFQTPSNLKPRLLGFVVLLGVVGVFELLGLGLLIPFMSSLLERHEDSKLMVFFNEAGIKNHQWVRVILGGGIIVLFVVKNLFYRWVVKGIAEFGFELYAGLSKDMFERYLNKPISVIKNTNTNYIIRDIDNVPNLFAQQVVFPLMNLISEIAVLLIITTILIIYDVRVLMFVLLVIIPPFSLYYTRVKSRVDFLAKKRHDHTGKLRRDLQEMLFGMSEVRVYGKREYFKNKFEEKVDVLKSINAQFHYYSSVPPKIIETALVIGIVLLFGAVVFLYETTEGIALTLSVFGLAAFRTLPSFNRILASLMGLKAGEFIFKILDDLRADDELETQEIGVQSNDLKVIQKFEQLEVRGVYHNYTKGSEYVLKNINFGIRSGKLIGIIGPSGSGKTTLMNILIGLIEPTEGSILLNNQIISGKGIAALWSVLGYVRQDAFMLDASVEENLALSKTINDKDREKMLKSLKMAGLQEFAMTGETGLLRNVGESGALLSGGQRQRLSIARALYSGASLIVYDEPTSAVDHKTEQKINETILHLRNQGVAQLIISHRTSILKDCDQVFEMSEGVLIERQKAGDLE